VLWARVPEAAVNEDRQPVPSKDDIRCAGHAARVEPVAAEAGGREGAAEEELAQLVANDLGEPSVLELCYRAPSQSHGPTSLKNRGAAGSPPAARALERFNSLE
jgi:hypothetical protein